MSLLQRSNRIGQKFKLMRGASIVGLRNLDRIEWDLQGPCPLSLAFEHHFASRPSPSRIWRHQYPSRAQLAAGESSGTEVRRQYAALPHNGQ